MAEQTSSSADIEPGDSPPEFVVAGDSHIFPMGAPFGYAGPASLLPIKMSRGRGYFLMEQWEGGRGASYWEALMMHAKGRVAAIVFRGNQHYANFLLARSSSFDLVDPTDEAYMPLAGAVLVPRRLVKASPLLSNDGLAGLIEQLRDAGSSSVIISGTPPVREDYGEHLDELRRNDSWQERAASMGVDLATCVCTPAPVMKRLWGVLQESLADIARAGGACFVPVPHEAINADGYLASKYRGPLSDFSHPNAAYGRLMMDSIAQVIAPNFKLLS